MAAHRPGLGLCLLNEYPLPGPVTIRDCSTTTHCGYSFLRHSFRFPTNTVYYLSLARTNSYKLALIKQ